MLYQYYYPEFPDCARDKRDFDQRCCNFCLPLLPEIPRNISELDTLFWAWVDDAAVKVSSFNGHLLITLNSVENMFGSVINFPSGAFDAAKYLITESNLNFIARPISHVSSEILSICQGSTMTKNLSLQI
jgi:hypothetical protein